MKSVFSFLIVVFTCGTEIFAQCVPSQPVPNLACGTGILLTDGVNINPGQTYYSNGGGPYQNVNLNGGTLILCGTVTFNSINYNSGTLLVKENADVTFNNNYNSGGDHWFYNLGNIVFNVSVQVSGSNTFVYNAAGASITVNGNMAVINSGLFINNGTTIVQDVNLNSGANVCLGNQSIVNMRGLNNNQTNAVTVGSGTACVSYTTSFGGNNPITNSTGLRICRQTGATAPAPVTVGTAVFETDCASCISLLPVKLEYFTGRTAGAIAQLEWKSSMEENVAKYQIEKSVNHGVFATVGEVPAKNTPAVYRHQLSIQEATSLRLKMIDLDGKFSYSNIITLKPGVAELSMRLKTNPVIGGVAQLEVLAAKKEQGQLRLIDASGTIRLNQPIQLNEGENTVRVNMQTLSAGAYYIIYEGTAGKSKPLTVVKN